MSNEFTKQQIKAWLEKAVEKARNPDPRERIRRERQERVKKTAQKFGF